MLFRNGVPQFLITVTIAVGYIFSSSILIKLDSLGLFKVLLGLSVISKLDFLGLLGRFRLCVGRIRSYFIFSIISELDFLRFIGEVRLLTIMFMVVIVERFLMYCSSILSKFDFLWFWSIFMILVERLWSYLLSIIAELYSLWFVGKIRLLVVLIKGLSTFCFSILSKLNFLRLFHLFRPFKFWPLWVLLFVLFNYRLAGVVEHDFLVFGRSTELHTCGHCCRHDFIFSKAINQIKII